jgi:hypothetical protein
MYKLGKKDYSLDVYSGRRFFGWRGGDETNAKALVFFFLPF